MRIATFNIENLFERPSIMNREDWEPGKKVLADYSRLNDLINKETYSEADQDEMIAIMASYNGLISNQESKYICLRVVRGQLVKKGKPRPSRPPDGPIGSAGSNW